MLPSRSAALARKRHEEEEDEEEPGKEDFVTKTAAVAWSNRATPVQKKHSSTPSWPPLYRRIHSRLWEGTSPLRAEWSEVHVRVFATRVGCRDCALSQKEISWSVVDKGSFPVQALLNSGNKQTKHKKVYQNIEDDWHLFESAPGNEGTCRILSEIWVYEMRAVCSQNHWYCSLCLQVPESPFCHKLSS